ncbi:MAG: endo-1,4-beta-xylanase [Rhodobiaceae bacterium]|nr:endo-1,4-beta-xylanase [Rhodobiaceae bacterium]
MAGALAVGLALPRPARADAGAPLWKLAADKGLAFGTAVSGKALRDPNYTALLQSECRVIVAENAFKWRFMEPEQNGRVRAFVGKKIAKFAAENDMALRGHTVYFHQATPDWADKAAQSGDRDALIEARINSLMDSFGDQVISWDVANEILRPEDGQPLGLRKDPFLGDDPLDVVVEMFKMTRDRAPHAELVYNEWCLPHDDWYFNARRDAILKLCETLLKRGAPMQAIGIQSHLNERKGPWDSHLWTKFLDDLAGMGLAIHLTELDISDVGREPTEERDRELADEVRKYLDVTLGNTAVKSVLTWGLSDRFGATRLMHPRKDKTLPRSLPYDVNYRVKPMRDAIAQALVHAPGR